MPQRRSPSVGHGVTGNLNFLHQIHIHPYPNPIGAIGLKFTQHAKSTTPNARGSRSQAKETFSPLFSQPDNPIVVHDSCRSSRPSLVGLDRCSHSRAPYFIEHSGKPFHLLPSE